MKKNEISTTENQAIEVLDNASETGYSAEAQLMGILAQQETGKNMQLYCSFQSDGDRAGKAKLYNAVNSTELKAKNLAGTGEVIDLVDVVLYPISLIDQQSGELKSLLCAILIDKDGNAYRAVSVGIANSLEKLFSLVGTPSYDPPLPVRIIKRQTRAGFETTLVEVVE